MTSKALGPSEGESREAKASPATGLSFADAAGLQVVSEMQALVSGVKCQN